MNYMSLILAVGDPYNPLPGQFHTSHSRSASGSIVRLWLYDSLMVVWRIAIMPWFISISCYIPPSLVFKYPHESRSRFHTICVDGLATAYRGVLLTFGGFLKCLYRNSCMAYFIENPKLHNFHFSFGVTPPFYFGHLHWIPPSWTASNILKTDVRCSFTVAPRSAALPGAGGLGVQSRVLGVVWRYWHGIDIAGMAILMRTCGFHPMDFGEYRIFQSRWVKDLGWMYVLMELMDIYSNYCQIGYYSKGSWIRDHLPGMY